MSSYSPYLEYFAQRLEGLSVGLFRLEMQNQTSGIASQSILRVTLPSNALVDMHSLAWHFDAVTQGGAATKLLRLPDGIESLIQRVEVTVGGVSVASGANFYNTLVAAKQRVDGRKRDAGRNHPKILGPVAASADYISGGLTGADNNEDHKGRLGVKAAPYCVTNWEGFLGTCEPRVIDTSLIGDVVVVIYLERPERCICSSQSADNGTNFNADATAPSIDYQINNSYFTVKCYSLATGVYDAMIAEQMQQSGALEVGFKQYFSFRDLNTGVTRFQVASQSLDRIIAAHSSPESFAKDAALKDKSTPIPRQGSIQGNRAVAAPDNTSVATVADTVPVSGVLPQHTLQDFMHPSNRFTAPTAAAGDVVVADTLFQYQLNGALVPQYRARNEDMYLITRQAGMKDCKDDHYESGYQNFLYDDFVTAIKLTMDAPNSRFIQGLDTRSVSLNGFYNITNNQGNNEITLFLECTSSLLISEGRQIEVVQ